MTTTIPVNNDGCCVSLLNCHKGDSCVCVYLVIHTYGMTMFLCNQNVENIR
jgi:hypothetical protein